MSHGNSHTEERGVNSFGAEETYVRLTRRGQGPGDKWFVTLLRLIFIVHVFSLKQTCP